MDRPGLFCVLSPGMDPNANIADQRILTSRLLNEPDDLTARYDLGELHQALDDSLAHGGTEPSDPDWRDVQRRSGALMFPPF
jgi:hypothetical protein